MENRRASTLQFWYGFMVRPVDARYQDGVLKPVETLALRPGERVRLIVLRGPDPARWDLKRLASAPEEDRAFAEAGIAEWADTLEAEDRG